MIRASLVAFALLCPTAALGDTRKKDGTHGRFDGDLGVAAAAGVTVGPRGPRASGDLRLRYLSTAGLFATYEDGPLVSSRAAPKRVLAFGIELRPLFLARWATDHELGVSRLDLLIDSLGLEVGAVVLQPAGASFGSRPGLQAGLGLEVPFFTVASGPFLGVHAGVRWSDSALSGGPLDDPTHRALYLTLSLGWQQLFGGHVVELGDPRPPSR